MITARLELPNASYPKAQDTADFYKNLLERVSVLPGVQSAAAAWWIPLSGSDTDVSFDVQERPLPEGRQAVAEVNVVTPEYFRTLRTPIALGRAFTERDDKNAPPVAIVSESFAKQYFPGGIFPVRIRSASGSLQMARSMANRRCAKSSA